MRTNETSGNRRKASGWRGTQRILDPGEAAFKAGGTSETQIRRHHPPIGPHGGTNQTVPLSDAHMGEREGKKNFTIESKKGRRTWPKPHRP